MLLVIALGGGDLGGGVRHLLRLAGRELRSERGAQERGGAAGRAAGHPAGQAAPRRDDSGAAALRLRRRGSVRWYYAGVVVAAGILVYEHRLVKPADLTRLDAAFFTMNGVMSVTVFGFALVDKLMGR